MVEHGVAFGNRRNDYTPCVSMRRGPYENAEGHNLRDAWCFLRILGLVDAAVS